MCIRDSSGILRVPLVEMELMVLLGRMESQVKELESEEILDLLAILYVV